MTTHAFVNSNPAKFDSNCSVCDGKQRDCVHNGSVIRYVVTKLDTSGTAPRTLFDAAQGQHTYATAEEAQKRADAFKTDRHCKGMALEVRPCECYPIHFDPKDRWFD
jgi:hypothetical protein